VKVRTNEESCFAWCALVKAAGGGVVLKLQEDARGKEQFTGGNFGLQIGALRCQIQGKPDRGEIIKTIYQRGKTPYDHQRTPERA